MAKRKTKTKTKTHLTVKGYTRMVCGKKQKVKAHNRKKQERTKQGRLL